MLAAVACGTPVELGRQPLEHLEVREISTGPVATATLLLPNTLTSVKFAVIGDSGRGWEPQYEIAAQMAAFRTRFKYPFVIMTGDNVYEGPATAADYQAKFERPYQPLLQEGVKFYAVLGNHDDPQQVLYTPFNMAGHRYYTFRPPEDPLARLAASVRFFAIDSTNLDQGQVQWIAEQLRESDSDWKICFLHHPLYSGGRYRWTSAAARWQLEPLFIQHGVDAVFSGHEHFYQRMRLQNGIQYFVSGGAGSLRQGDATPAPFVARSFDRDYHFMLVEIDGDVLYFQAISRTGETVDSGALSRTTSTTSSPGRPALR